MGSAVDNVCPRRNGIQEGATGPYIPYSSVNDPLAVTGSLIVREIKPIVVVQFKEGLARVARKEGLASDARALGEAQDFSGRESVDGLTAPTSAQKTGTGTHKLSRPEQTRSLEPLVSTDESTSQADKPTETSGQDKQEGPLAVGELDAVG